LRRRFPIIGVFAACLLALGLLSRIAPSGYTRIDLTGDGKGRDLLSVVVRDGEKVTLTWRHSQFGLRVTEVFIARGGVLVQDQVTFTAPGGPPPPRVSPRDVEDLYHTGGAFDARGLSRPFRRIVYRIGEIGDPAMNVQGRTVSFKQAAGFGGRLILTATRPALYEIVWLRSLPARYRFSPDPDREHGHRTSVDSIHRKTDRVAFPPESDHVNQWQIVIGRRDGQHRVASKRLVGDQRAVVSCKQKLAGLAFESHGPLEGFRRLPPPGVGMQVVHEIAASDDQNPFVA
jgi:hypothetical protein